MAGVKSLHQINKLEKLRISKNDISRISLKNNERTSIPIKEIELGNLGGVDGTRTHANDAGHARGRTPISKEKESA